MSIYLLHVSLILHSPLTHNLLTTCYSLESRALKLPSLRRSTNEGDKPPTPPSPPKHKVDYDYHLRNPEDDLLLPMKNHSDMISKEGPTEIKEEDDIVGVLKAIRVFEKEFLGVDRRRSEGILTVALNHLYGNVYRIPLTMY